MMSDTEIKQSLRTFIATFAGHADESDDERDIFRERHVSSLFAMQLVLFVESTFGFRVAPEDMDLKNFRSVGALHRFIRAKQAAGVCT